MPKQQEEQPTLKRDKNGHLHYEIRHDGELVHSGLFDGVPTFRLICRVMGHCKGCRVYIGGRELVNFDLIRKSFPILDT